MIDDHNVHEQKGSSTEVYLRRLGTEARSRKQEPKLGSPTGQRISNPQRTRLTLNVTNRLQDSRPSRIECEKVRAVWLLELMT